jgi:uncharacterized membrane protein YecN with MAPEG domain
MILPITLTMAGATTLINLWLAFRVGQVRTREKVMMGDGGNMAVIARMRAHANFTEYTPFFLILLGLIEYAWGTSGWLWGAGILYIVARIAHAFGMDRPAPNAFRMIGMLVNLLVLLGLAITAIAIPYTAPAVNDEVVFPGG